MKKIKLLFAALALLCIFAPGAYAYDAVYNDFDRTGWVAAAPPLSPVDDEDGVQATADAHWLLDGNHKTFLSMVKPGKTYGNITTSPNAWEELYFTIDFSSDLTKAELFDYFRIKYRYRNQNEYLRPWEITIYGSNGIEPAGQRAWTLIYSAAGQEIIPLPNGPVRGADYDYEDPIQLTNTTPYTSIKVVYRNGSLASGSTCQMAEFSLGKVSYDKVVNKPADISFGDVMQGSTATKELLVSGANLDTPVIYTLSGDDAAAFSVTPVPGALTTISDKATVTFTPTAKKFYTATLTINSLGAVEAQQIMLTGNADFDLPVQISSGTNEYWYFVQFARQAVNGKALTEAAGDTVKQVPLNTTDSRQLWKVTGTWDNYQLVNKSGKALFYVPASEDTGSGQTVPEAYITTGTGDKFGFVRYNTTDTWQLLNITSTTVPAGRTYLNDISGNSAGGYSLNNAGNQLLFTADATGFVIPGENVKLGATNINTSKELSIVVGGVKLTSNINVALSDDTDGVFTLNTTTLPTQGDSIKITYSPVAYKDTSYVKITLTSGSASKTFVAWATSDVGISKYYLSTSQQWGTRADGDLVSTVPTLKAGDILWIAGGEYTTGQISVPANVSIYGGFTGTETSPEQRAVGSKPWEFTNATVLKNSAALVISITGANTVIDGITFDGGTGVTGRAIQNTGSSNKEGILRNSIIKNFNSGDNDGGGMNIRYKTEIYNCLITGNRSNKKGGGGYFDDVIIHDCEVTGNSVPVDATTPVGSGNGGGGGLFLANVAGTVAYNCYIAGNTASFGGGVFLNGSKIYNSIIVNNTATSGSGIAFDERRTGSAYNVTVADNHATKIEGAGVCFTADGSDRAQELYNAILYNNTDIGGVEAYNIGVNQSGAGFAKPIIKSVIIDDVAWYVGENPNLAIVNGINETDASRLFVAGSYVTSATSPGKEMGIYMLKEEVINEDMAVETPAVYLEFATGKDFAGGVRVVGTIDIGPYEDQTGLAIITPKVSEGNVIATKYYNIQGIEVTGTSIVPGIYIKRELLDNGTARASKVLLTVGQAK